MNNNGIFLSNTLLEIMFNLNEGKAQLIDLLKGTVEIARNIRQFCDIEKDQDIINQCVAVEIEVEYGLLLIEENYYTFL